VRSLSHPTETMVGVQPTRILVAGDIHGDLPFLARVADRAVAEGCSTILQLGDLGALWPGSERFLQKIDKVLARAGINRLVFVDGNHEGFVSRVPFRSADRGTATGGLAMAEHKCAKSAEGFRLISERVEWIPRGCRWEWNGVRFGAIGGAFSVDWRGRTPGTSWWPDHENVVDADVERLGTAPLDVLVTHDVPLGVPIDAISSFRLSPSDESNCALTRERLREAVEATQPSLVLHGHWHWKHGTNLDWPDSNGTPRRARVEGFGANVDGDVDWATAVLDLSDSTPSIPAGPPLPS
jgi:Calcineurin-like phosphoesterase